MEGIFYSIGEVSERLGVTYRTLHYYENKFNLQINRDGAGNRIYTEENVEILEQILALKSKGMSLDGIKALFQEKGLIKKEENSNLIVVDEKTIELKELLITEIKKAVSDEIQKELEFTKELLEKVIEDNNNLRDEIRKMQRQSEEHFKKFDERLTDWRNKQQPWYKKLFSKPPEK